MGSPKILVIGQGDIGLPVTNVLVEQGRSTTGLARSARESYDLHADADYIQADALDLTTEQLQDFTRIVIIVTPDDYSTAGYNASYLSICEHLGSLAADLPKLERVVFISSTGVYGQDNGEWIDDATQPTTPKRDASKVILRAEQALQHAFGDRAIIIRPSGIYGRQRLMRLRKVRESNPEPIAAEHWSNRIMDRDLVTIIAHVLTMDTPKPLYIATDYAPVTTLALTRWLSQQVDETSPAIDHKKASVTGKRLHSNIPLAWLKYPDWQSGYTDILHYQNTEYG